MTSRRRRSLLRAINPQRRSPPSRNLGPSLRPRLLPHQPKPRGKLPHTNGVPPTGRRRVPEEKAALSVYTPATSEKPERKTEPGAKPAQPPGGPAAAPGKAPPEDLPPAERKTGKSSA